MNFRENVNPNIHLFLRYNVTTFPKTTIDFLGVLSAGTLEEPVFWRMDALMPMAQPVCICN